MIIGRIVEYYEAQVDYYTKYIKERAYWEFDLIITKGVSCFARNTVGCFVTVHQLKEQVVEVYLKT